MINLTGTIPANWTKDDLQRLEFVEDYHKDTVLNDILVRAGHNIENMKIGLLQEHMGLPSWAIETRDRFNLDNKTATIHRLLPGKYLPIHSDLYDMYKKLHDSNGKRIARIIVFLEDWQPGHMLDIQGTIYNRWRAGDHVGWLDDTQHAAYNMGMVDRYTLQITGMI